jgi:F0F1-type ATP synthase alpha subunit
MPVEEQVAVIFAAANGFCDDMEVSKILDFEKGLLKLPTRFKGHHFKGHQGRRKII